ncbi:hypothetical protein ACFLWI_03095 [Chloroflexota bacterium]
MGEKKTYLTILRRFVGFKLKHEDYQSEIHYNAAVTQGHEMLLVFLGTGSKNVP